jgi:hypothetical protein
MTALADLIAAGQEFGVFQVFLPLVLSYAIIYGLLKKMKVFDDKTNIVVSAILAWLIIGYTPLGSMFTEYIANTFTGTVLVVVTLLGSMMIIYVLANLVGINIPLTAPGAKKWAILLLGIALVLALGVFVSSGGVAFFPGLTLPGVTIPNIPIPVLPSIGLTTGHLAVLFMVLGFGAVLWYLTKGGGGE